MPLREKVYLSRDNSIKLGLTADGAPVNAATMTRVKATLTNSSGTVTTYDSNSDTNAFDFTTETAQVSDIVTGMLVITLQDANSPPAVGADYVMNVIVYDDAHPRGINWDSPFPVEVVA